MQRQQFAGIPVETGNRQASAPPRARLFPQGGGLGGHVKGFFITRWGHRVRHGRGRERGRPAVEKIDGTCMGAIQAQRRVRLQLLHIYQMVKRLIERNVQDRVATLCAAVMPASCARRTEVMTPVWVR